MSETEPSLDREEFVALAEDADRPAVVRTTVDLDVDVEPLAAYAALADASGAAHTFLLESGEKLASSDPDGAFAPASEERHARYSFVGYDPAAAVTLDPDGTDVDVFDSRYADLVDPGEGDVLDRLRGSLPGVERVNFPATDRQQLDGGLVGFLAYDAVYDLHLDEVGVDRPDSQVPDAQFVLTTKTLAFDHAADAVSLVCTPLVRPGDDAGAVYDALVREAQRVREALTDATVDPDGFVREQETAESREAYEAAVERGKEHVLDGDSYQVVLSRARELVGEIDPRGLYAALRDINPSPYMYLLEYGDRSVVGASPETLVSVRGNEVVSNPLAGTCPRGASPVEDRRLAGELLADEKERAEHTMLVDLARNDVRRVSEPGSVRVGEFMTVLKYSHVQHIESTVTGRLAADADAFDATRAAFPMGTLSGAPKIRAMEIIDALETSPRGLYGGGVGYFSWDGDADVAIVIRTALIDHAPDEGGVGEGATTDRITVRAGAGVVADSDPASEYEETERKMDGVIAALDRIEQPADVTPPPEVSR
ncbi:anthranilate synthase component I [Halococcus agarilyticus]|uniref:anthranilate synthase component I n=1 Tax=Halococcus agarilyticus TaxID=1232219 RepID=UPI000677C4A0|nr:anthranilate synthase component I [Halococcus agarilyticus]